MALKGFLRLEGATHGPIPGSSTQTGRVGAIEIIGVSHEIGLPRDAISGLPSGRRKHGPFGINKEIDAASPRLYAALCSNEGLTAWTLEFWATVPGDHRRAEVQRYAIELTDARVASIALRMNDTTGDASTASGQYEEVMFTYSKIEWMWMDGRVSAEDAWNPREAVQALVGEPA